MNSTKPNNILTLPKGAQLLATIYNQRPSDRYQRRILLAARISDAHARRLLSYLCDNGYLRQRATNYRTYYDLTELGEKTALAALRLSTLVYRAPRQ